MSDATTSRAETRNRIVEDAARLLAEEGPSALTTRGVAERAGVQAPTIYRLFGDKDGLLEAVAEHVMATYVATKASVVASASDDDVDPLEDLRAGWQTQIEFGLANPTIFRLLSDPTRELGSAAAQAGLRVLAARVHRVALRAQLRVSEARAVNLIHAAGTGTINSLLSTPPEERDPHLAEDMYDAVIRQILRTTPKRANGTSMATAVAFRALAPQLTVLSDAERSLLGEWLDRAVHSLGDEFRPPATSVTA